MTNDVRPNEIVWKLRPNKGNILIYQDDHRNLCIKAKTPDANADLQMLIADLESISKQLSMDEVRVPDSNERVYE